MLSMEANLWVMQQLVASRTEDLRRAADRRRLIGSGLTHDRRGAISGRLGAMLIRAGHRLSGPDVPVGTGYQPHLPGRI